MKTPKFQIGDVVKLKSEQQKMTIEQILKNTDFNGLESFEGYYKCVWLDN